jgi:hypothetical protein
MTFGRSSLITLITPTKAVEHLGSTDIAHVLPSIGAVLVAVILECHHLHFPSHIQVRHKVPVADSDLRPWPW